MQLPLILRTRFPVGLFFGLIRARTVEGILIREPANDS